jgi:hypothetical protein
VMSDTGVDWEDYDGGESRGNGWRKKDDRD